MKGIATLAVLSCIAWTASDSSAPPVAETSFGLDLYRHLSVAEGNLCVSPPSLSAVLEISLEGARGRTRSQIAEVLRIDSVRQRDPAPTLADREGERLALASALWAQSGFDFRDDYLTAIREGYGAGLERLDFAADVERARDAINRWAADRTGGGIEELLASGVLDADTVLVLTNAVYFAGRWLLPFDEERTSEAEFRTPGGGTIDVPFMTRTDSFSYAGLDQLDLLELPYAGGRLTMVLLLPHEDEGLGDVERMLTTEKLAVWLKELEPRPVHLRLPRFALQARLELVEALRTMGMTDAFGEQADFTGMSPAHGLFVSDVVHSVRIEVDERGTVGAAASGLAMSKGSRPAQFIADHPFLFVIRDRSDGRVWFLGRVVLPTA